MADELDKNNQTIKDGHLPPLNVSSNPVQGVSSVLLEQQAKLRTDLEIVTELLQRQISANAHVAMDQAEYQRQYDEYEARYHEIQRRIAELEASRETLTAKRGKLKGYLDLLRSRGLSGRSTKRYGAAWLSRYGLKRTAPCDSFSRMGLWLRGKTQ